MKCAGRSAATGAGRAAAARSRARSRAAMTSTRVMRRPVRVAGARQRSRSCGSSTRRASRRAATLFVEQIDRDRHRLGRHDATRRARGSTRDVDQVREVGDHRRPRRRQALQPRRRRFERRRPAQAQAGVRGREIVADRFVRDVAGTWTRTRVPRAPARARAPDSPPRRRPAGDGRRRARARARRSARRIGAIRFSARHLSERREHDRVVAERRARAARGRRRVAGSRGDGAGTPMRSSRRAAPDTPRADRRRRAGCGPRPAAPSASRRAASTRSSRSARRALRRRTPRSRGARRDGRTRTRGGSRRTRSCCSSARARAWCSRASCSTTRPGKGGEVPPHVVVARRVAELVDDEIVGIAPLPSRRSRARRPSGNAVDARARTPSRGSRSRRCRWRCRSGRRQRRKPGERIASIVGSRWSVASQPCGSRPASA